MENHIFLLGNRSNVLDYLSAADLLLHLSETEASNSVVKEAGLAKKPVIVCERVGDFEDYIVHGQNGFLVNKEEPVSAATAIVTNYCALPAELKEIGLNLQHTVLKQFDIANVSDNYDKIINSTAGK